VVFVTYNNEDYFGFTAFRQSSITVSRFFIDSGSVI